MVFLDLLFILLVYYNRTQRNWKRKRDRKRKRKTLTTPQFHCLWSLTPVGGNQGLGPESSCMTVCTLGQVCHCPVFCTSTLYIFVIMFVTRFGSRTMCDFITFWVLCSLILLRCKNSKGILSCFSMPMCVVFPPQIYVRSALPLGSGSTHCDSVFLFYYITVFTFFFIIL